MALSLLLGFLNTSKVKGLRNEIVTTISARENADRSRMASEKKLKARETDFTAATSKVTFFLRAQNGHTDLTTLSAVAVRGRSALPARIGG